MSTSTKTGGSVDYYTCTVPAERTIDGRPGYDAQCLEIIETLGMSFAEGEAFKAIWRSCAARTLGKVKADCDALYNAEKVAFYGQRMVVEAKMQGELAEGLIDATCATGAEKFAQSEWGKSELPKSAIPEGATHWSEADEDYFESFWKDSEKGALCFALDGIGEPEWILWRGEKIPDRAKRIGGSAGRPLAGR